MGTIAMEELCVKQFAMWWREGDERVKMLEDWLLCQRDGERFEVFEGRDEEMEFVRSYAGGKQGWFRMKNSYSG